MPHVFFVLPDLGYTAAAKQVSLIAPALTEPDWSSTVFPLTRAGRHGPFTGPLRANEVMVLESSGRSAVRWLGLRFVVPRPGHGLIHAFGLAALRRLWVGIVGSRRAPILVSLTGRERLCWFDRRCLRIVNRVLVPHQHAADALAGQGVPAKRISVLTPAVKPPEHPQRDEGGEATPRLTPGVRRGPGEPPASAGGWALAPGKIPCLPHGGPLLVTAGSMPDRLRLLTAVWMFEFVRYPHPDLQMLVVGDGPGRMPLEATARGLAPEGSRIHFLGERSDLPGLLAAADVAVVLHREGGVNVALEAMAAGRAVVAADTPELAAIVRDRETGRLVPAGNAQAAAAAVHQLLLDPAERQRLGVAARDHVTKCHQIGTVIQTLEAIYRDEFTSTRSGLGAE
jgi:glycosyltransferase involved in cell wall biosynthesis